MPGGAAMLAWGGGAGDGALRAIRAKLRLCPKVEGCFIVLGGMKVPLVKPMLAVAADPFDDQNYFFEVKWDGYRCLAYLDECSTTLVSRNLKDITGAFPELHSLHRHVAELPAVLDGEIIVLQEGKPSFSALQSRAALSEKNKVQRAAGHLPALYMAFDLLYQRGRPLMERPLVERAQELSGVVKQGDAVLLSERVRAEGKLFYRACVERGLEGAMAKRVDSKYLPGTRSPLWKKLRHTREADLVICGYRTGRGSRLLGALLLGAWDGSKHVYQGMVGTGISGREELSLLQKLKALQVNSATLVGGPAGLARVHWVLPEMVCRVEYLTLTRDGLLRHPVYKGLRYDKSPRECSPLQG